MKRHLERRLKLVLTCGLSPSISFELLSPNHMPGQTDNISRGQNFIRKSFLLQSLLKPNIQAHLFNPVSRVKISCSCSQMLIYRIVSQSTIVRHFLMLHRTKCKPMQFEWERFSDLFVLHRTICQPIHFCWTKQNERERCFRRGVCRQYSAHFSYVCVNISDFCSRPPKLKQILWATQNTEPMHF